MPFDPTLAAIRFGSGLSPKFAPPRSAAELLAEINEAPPFRVAAFEAVQPTVSDFQAAFKRVRDARDTAELDAREQEYREVRIAANDVYYNAIQATMARHVGADFGFAERLCAFWADHFTVKERWSWFFDQFYAAQRSGFGFILRSKLQSWFLSSIGFDRGQQAVG